MNQPASGILVGALTCAALLPLSASAITIEFNYDYDTLNFFNPERQSVLRAAGDYFENRIQDSLAPITNEGNNTFTALFSRPDTGASESASFDVAADTLVIFVGGQNFSGNTLGEGGPGGFSGFGSNDFFRTIRARGQSGILGVDPDTDFAPWGGSIAFNTSSNWYFDDDVSTLEPITGSDFFSVAIHEIGHVLGYGTSESWDSKVVNGEFTGAASMAVWGGPVPLSDRSHWANGTQSLLDGVLAEAALDPSLTVGTRKLYTELDWAGLEDIGWEVTAVPLPAPALLLLGALFTLTGMRRKQ